MSCFGLFAIAWAREPRAPVVMDAEPAASAKPWRLVKPKAAGIAPAVIEPLARKPRRSRKPDQAGGDGRKALPWPRAVGPDAEA